MVPYGHTISCRRCPYCFEGHAVCMKCATGYQLELPANLVTNPLARLVKVYRMETEQVRGNLRCKMNNVRQPTDVLVPVEVEKTERHGLQIETVHFLLDEVVCPHCCEPALKCVLDDPDICPSCGRKALSKGVTWVSIV